MSDRSRAPTLLYQPRWVEAPSHPSPEADGLLVPHAVSSVYEIYVVRVDNEKTKADSGELPIPEHTSTLAVLRCGRFRWW